MDKNKTKHDDAREVLLEWETLEFMPTPRGKTWYVVAGLVVAGLLAYAIHSQSWTMALAFIMLVVVFLITKRRQPRTVKVVITDMGVEYRGRFYPYHHINAFWMVYHPPYVRALYLRLSNGRNYKLLRIELYHQKPQEVRELLLRELPEIEGAQEPFSDLMSRILRLQ